MYSRLLSRHFPSVFFSRSFSATVAGREGTVLNNILAGGPAPAVQVRKVSQQGIELADGLVLPGPCIFIDGQIFLWNVEFAAKRDWSSKDFEIFNVVIPKPEILILGTGNTLAHPPSALRSYLNGIGIQLDVMDTWNASTTYNMLTEEGRRVAAALLPLRNHVWHNTKGLA